MHHSAQPSLTRADAAYTLPFLAAAAADLSELGWLSEIEADQFRISLKERHRHLASGDASLLSELYLEESTVMRLLQALYGARELAHILMRFTIARSLEDYLSSLKQMTQDILKKSELLFNQKFFLYQNDTCYKRTYFSFILVDLASFLQDEFQGLEQLLTQIKVLVSNSPWSGEYRLEFERKLADHLGFRFEGSESYNFGEFSAILRKIALHFEVVHEHLLGFTDQLIQNLDAKDQIDQIQLLLEDWQAYIGQFKAQPKEGIGSFERQEKRRLRILGTLLTFRDILESLNGAFFDALKTSHIKKQAEFIWPEAEQKELVAILLKNGIPLHEACLALNQLINYIHHHHISPSRLLGAELKKIHSSFDESVLSALKMMALDQTVSPQIIEEKNNVMRHKEHILRTISPFLLTWLFFPLLMTISSAACGVKTAPRSDVLDLRPSVPYHAGQRVSAPAEPSKELNTKPSKSE